jgi:hypothetical protein
MRNEFFGRDFLCPSPCLIEGEIMATERMMAGQIWLETRGY